MQVEQQAPAVAWYRSPVDAGELKKLYQRSDFLGFVQTLGYLGVLVVTGSASVYSASHFPWYVTVLLLFLHGTGFAFLINGVHELGHNTVFQTKSLNVFFVHVLAFLGWVNHRAFEASHVRHHRSTLHPPDDLEVVLPVTFSVKGFFQSAFVNLGGPAYVVNLHLRYARQEFAGDWELKLFPESNLERRQFVARWSRTVLVGHALILIVSLCLKLWMLPVVISLAPFYGSWLLFLCNNTQHVGLQDNTSDFRLCCRTFIPNPLVRFLYWHMNYHTEHHMYVGIPCYHLGKLHKLIAGDLPPTPQGLLATWREIAAILKKQKENPAYQYAPPLPGTDRTSMPSTIALQELSDGSLSGAA